MWNFLTSSLLPAWLPSWAILIIPVLVGLYLLLFLIMPFSVFGLKGRIGALEGQIEALHDEVRMLAMRAAGIIPPPDAAAAREALSRPAYRETSYREAPYREAPHREAPYREARQAPLSPPPEPPRRAELPEFERLKNAQRITPAPAAAPMFPPARKRSDAPVPPPRGRAEPRLD